MINWNIKRRTIALCMAAALLLTAAGCGGPKPDEDDGTSTVSTGATESLDGTEGDAASQQGTASDAAGSTADTASQGDASSKPVSSGSTAGQNDYVPKKVTLLLWDENTEASAKGEWIRTRQAMFSKKYPEITIKRIITPVQAGDAQGDRIAFTTAIAAGTAPNAYSGGHFSVMPLWIQNGFAEPLDQYTKNWADFGSISKTAFSSATVNGKVYGIPEYMYVLCLAYNKALYKAAGLDPEKGPATWDELRENAVKLTKPDKSQYGLALIGNSTADWWYQLFAWQAGAELSSFDSKGKVSVNYTSAGAKKALQFYQDLRFKYNVLQPDFSATINSLQQDFATGKCAQIIYSSHFYETMVGFGMKDENLGLATLPVGPSGKQVTANGGAYWFISSKGSADQKRAAWEYIKFMTSKEAQIEYYETLEAYGSRSPIFSFYDDIDPSKYINFNRSWVNTFNQAMKSARAESALVESLRPYLNKAVESVLIDKNASIDALLAEAQRDAVNDVVNPYNSKIK